MEGKRLTDVFDQDQKTHVVPISREFSIPITVEHQQNHHDGADSIDNSTSLSVTDHERPSQILFDRATRYAKTLSSRAENLVHHHKKQRAIKVKRRSAGAARAAVLVSFVLTVVQIFHPFAPLADATKAATIRKVQAGLVEMHTGQQLLATKQFEQARQHFVLAASDFQSGHTVLSSLGQTSRTLPYVAPDSVAVADALVESAHNLAEAGIDAAELLQNISASLNNLQVPSTTDPLQKVSSLLTALISNNQKNSDLADSILHYTDAANQLITAHAAEPVANDQLENARLKMVDMLPPLISASTALSALFHNLPALLGMDRNRRYLILFQNNRELRPMGGFIGSFATMILKKGGLDAFSIETNIYKRDNTFDKAFEVTAPYPISTILPKWYMRDANWDVDVSKSAAQVAWFFKQEGGTDVDGVIAIDTTFMENFLKLTGPVEVPSQNITVTDQNFASAVQYKTEKEYLENPEVNALNEPKKVLADMFPIFLQKIVLKVKENPLSISDVFGQMIAEKHFLFNSFFDAGSAIVNASHLNNPLPAHGDFLMISNANLGGYKSSLNIVQKVDVEVTPTDHETLLHTVVVTRSHTGSTAWPDGDNHNFTRIVIPYNSLYLSSKSNGTEASLDNTQAQIQKVSLGDEPSGTKAQDIPGYQTIGHWFTTPVGQTRVATFVYETPLSFDIYGREMYDFAYLKQPGWLSDNLTVNFDNSQGIEFNIAEPHFHQVRFVDASWHIPLTHTSGLSKLLF